VQIFAGLGNPGAAYALHRHNIGFMAVDSIAAVHGFGPFKSRFQGLVSEGRIGAQRVTLLKPATYMNESGRSVGEALRFWKLEAAAALTVFYDELDLDPFKVRVKHGGGAAGHNGIRSLDAHIGADYRRVAHRNRTVRGIVTRLRRMFWAISPSPRWTLWPMCSVPLRPKFPGCWMATMPAS